MDYFSFRLKQLYSALNTQALFHLMQFLWSFRHNHMVISVYMWLLSESPGNTRKHLPLILHGVKGLMKTAPCILNKCHISFAFATLPPKAVWLRTTKDTHIFVWHTSQNCPQSQHSLLAHTTTNQPTASSESWIISQQSNKTLSAHIDGIFVIRFIIQQHNQ